MRFVLLQADKMNKIVIVLGVCLTFMFSFIFCAPQSNSEVLSYAPYNYDYKVEDAEKKLFFDKTEAGDDTGKVTGRYSVWLPDGRLMVVEYTADLQNGFVPRISFVNNANPISG